jgi:hypothetical protein
VKYPNRKRAVLIALDQLLGAIVTGWPDPTLSAWAWVWERDGKRAWPRRVIDRVAGLLGDDNHCRESYRSEKRQRQLPEEMRQGD